MKKIILVKLGGSVITDKSKPYTARPEIIKNLAQQIKTAWGKDYRFVISHGSGSFGHTSAAKFQTAEGLKNKESVYGLAIVQQDALTINRIVNKIFLNEGLPVLSFVPSSFSLAIDGKPSAIFSQPIVEALKIDALPLVFGDVILDKAQGCCIFSGEVILDNLILPLTKAGFKIKRIIQAGNTDGVYDQKGKTLPIISSKNFAGIKQLIKGSNATDVTGGMLHKIEESLKIAEKGIDCLIISGEKKGTMLKSILGRPVQGTLVTK